MVAINSASIPKSGGIISKKLIIIFALILVIGLLLLTLYFYLTIKSIINNEIPQHKGPLPKPSIFSSIQETDILSYYNAQYLIPFVFLNYKSYNTSTIYANVSLYEYPPPKFIYILNTTNECFNCGNATAIEDSLYSYLVKYNIVNNTSDINIISINNVQSVPSDSVLIILDGLLPSQLLNSAGQNTTILDSLLNRHISVIYVGLNFSQVIMPGPIEGKTDPFTLPRYLQTIPRFTNSTKHASSNFYFKNSTFAFRNGSNYSSITYENPLNGSIVAFSNNGNSWGSSSQEGHDIAKVIQLLFWLPKFAYGSRTIFINSTDNFSSNQFGVLLNSTLIPLNSSFLSHMNDGAIRVVITANKSYYYQTSNTTYQYIVQQPNFYYNGSLGISNVIVTNSSNLLSYSFIIGSSSIAITPHFEIYTTNLTRVFSNGIPFSTNVVNNNTYLTYQNFLLAPNTSYIIKLGDFFGKQYSAAYFKTAPLVITLLNANTTSDRFEFQITSEKMPITNLNYNMELNNLYPSNGVIKNGVLNYSVPRGTPTIRGNLNFTLTVLGSKTNFPYNYYILPFGINEQYVEIAIVVILMLAMILFVKTPNRDEFYIDIPNLPEENKTKVVLKAKDLMDVFDKLNLSYHWRYMPLSKAEFKSAISNNLRFNNIPIALTYSNVERLLDELTVKKYLVSAGELYAPTQWINQSKHDIDYLATFKKLRLYLVTHGYIFTDLDMSTNSDIVATLRSEKKYIVIYSKTSKFQKVPIYSGSKTYIMFLNSYKLEEFRNSMYNSNGLEAEELKMYIDADFIRLVDVENPEGLMN